MTRDEIMSTHEDFSRNSGRRKKLEKLIFRYLGAAASDDAIAQKNIRTQMWNAGGPVFLRLVAAVLHDPSIRTIDGHPTRTHAARQTARRAHFLRLADPKQMKAWLRQRRTITSPGPSAVTPPPKAQRRSVLAAGMAQNRALTGGKRGISQITDANRATFEKMQTSLERDAADNPKIVAQAKKRAQMALKRESKPVPHERPSEHARSFPGY